MVSPFFWGGDHRPNGGITAQMGGTAGLLDYDVFLGILTVARVAIHITDKKRPKINDVLSLISGPATSEASGRLTLHRIGHNGLGVRSNS